MMPALGCTIIRAADGAVLAKRIKRDSAGGFSVCHFDHATWFMLEAASAGDLRTFGRILYRIAHDPRMAIVRGRPLPHVAAGKAYLRRARRDDGTNSLADCARAWVAVDMDDMPLPPGVDWRVAHEVVAYLQTLLPPELRGVDCLLAWSASMGFGVPGLANGKLFYALTEPLTDDALRDWAKAWNTQHGAKLIDPSLFHPIQLHYIANPILAPGIADPLAGVGRWHWVPGMFAERATILLPKAALPVSLSVGVRQTLNDTSSQSFTDRLMRIGAPGEGFFEPLKAVIGMAVRKGLSREATIVEVRKAVLAADPGGRSQHEIQRYASDQFIGEAWTSFARQDATRRAAEDGKEFKVEKLRRRRVRNLADYNGLKRQHSKGGTTL
jgi:hypothetical protein